MCTIIVLLTTIVGVKLYVSHALYQSEKTYNVIRGKVPYFSSGDIQISYTVDNKVASTFPKERYYAVSVDCGDTATGDWNSEKWLLEISNATSEKIKCNITFIKNPTLVKYITTLAETDTTNLAYDGTDDNNLRYIGNPNNYVKFSGSDTLWRIIGVMNNVITSGDETKSLVKLIRASSIGNNYWNDGTSTVSSFNASSLKTYLNETYYNSELSNYANYVESVNWYTVSTNETGTNAQTTYETERSTSTWTGNVSLIYVSDYEYATNGNGSEDNRTTCLSSWSATENCASSTTNFFTSYGTSHMTVNYSVINIKYQHYSSGATGVASCVKSYSQTLTTSFQAYRLILATGDFSSSLSASSSEYRTFYCYSTKTGKTLASEYSSISGSTFPTYPVIHISDEVFIANNLNDSETLGTASNPYIMYLD